MKIEIIKDGLRNGDDMQILKKGAKIDISEKRAKLAIERGHAREIKTRKKKSQQKDLEDNLEKK